MQELTQLAPPSHPSLGARDVRERGHWTKCQRAKNWLFYQAIRLALLSLDGLRERWLLALGRCAGRTLYVCGARARKRAFKRARKALGPAATKTFVLNTFIRAGENLALCLLLRRASVRASRFVNVDEAARHALSTAVAEGRGVVVVSAHLGPFELLAARVAELGLAPAVVVRESYDPRLDPVVDTHRIRQGVSVIHRGRPGAAARMLRALRQDRPLGFLIDLPARVRSISLTFLGARTMVPLGPQRLCQLTGARLLIGTLQRRSAHTGSLPYFDLRMTSLDHETVARDSIVALTQRVSQQLERDIIETPEDWLWMAE